jgi:hypothetical protein
VNQLNNKKTYGGRQGKGKNHVQRNPGHKAVLPRQDAFKVVIELDMGPDEARRIFCD